ncbi:hypothetical protein C8N46_104319 [Kordia periserrulae]|uniref:Uncharacterized protein n=1 Tax=Kordia periserrulae TaxID=701523 RepID=A0A2T6C030_9FLAO|nr:hypothetical protein [Kordia periserrulae]PTX61675.1 hypothetical protein C8N46_104319 [Kordia periserrulae]
MHHPLHLIYMFIGFLYLWIRYRDRKKVASAKKELYDDSYSVAGATVLLSVVGAIFFIVLLIFLIGTIYIIFTRPPSPY